MASSRGRHLRAQPGDAVRPGGNPRSVQRQARQNLTTDLPRARAHQAPPATLAATHPNEPYTPRAARRRAKACAASSNDARRTSPATDELRQCAGNRWLPRIELAADLEGGGSVVFLEFVAPVDHPVAEQWRARAGDPEFAEVRRATQMIDAEYRKSTPWWGGYDLDEARIFRAADRPVLIDVFCMAGTELYRGILQDVAEVHRRIPRERMRYALETPYIARDNSTAEILALSGQFTTRLSRGSGFFRRTQVQRSSRPATASTTPTATRKSCRRVPLRPSLPPACRQFEAPPWYPK